MTAFIDLHSISTCLPFECMTRIEVPLRQNEFDSKYIREDKAYLTSDVRFGDRSSQQTQNISLKSFLKTEKITYRNI